LQFDYRVVPVDIAIIDWKYELTATGCLLTRQNGIYAMPAIAKPKRFESDIFAQESPNAVGFLFRASDNREFWFATENEAEDAIQFLKAKGLAYLTLTSIPSPHFPKLLSQFGETMSGKKPPLNLLLALNKVTPMFSEKTAEILRGNNHFRSTIADLLFQKNTDGIKALVYVKREKGERAEIPEWISVRHLSKSWFGCPTVEDAVSVKLACPTALVFELEDA
jgi:hypothetical protein